MKKAKHDIKRDNKLIIVVKKLGKKIGDVVLEIVIGWLFTNLM